MSKHQIIDCHVHIYDSKERGQHEKKEYEIWEYGRKTGVQYSKYGGDLEDTLQAMHESNVNKAAALSYLPVTIANLRQNALANQENSVSVINLKISQMLLESNVANCELARIHSDLLPFILIDPNAMSPDESEAHLREMVTHGAKGVKLHPILQRFYPNDKRMRPIYKTCVDLAVPILSHSGSARGAEQYAEPDAFVEVLKEFPRLTLILAHLGGGSWQQTLNIAKKYQNACFDCSEIIEWLGAPSAPTPHELAELIKKIGPHRVMMGSDFPWYDLDRTVHLISTLPVLSDEEKQGILGENATQILGI
jgi:hypothetical protein